MGDGPRTGGRHDVTLLLGHGAHRELLDLSSKALLETPNPEDMLQALWLQLAQRTLPAAATTVQGWLDLARKLALPVLVRWRDHHLLPYLRAQRDAAAAELVVERLHALEPFGVDMEALFDMGPVLTRACNRVTLANAVPEAPADGDSHVENLGKVRCGRLVTTLVGFRTRADVHPGRRFFGAFR